MNNPLQRLRVQYLSVSAFIFLFFLVQVPGADLAQGSDCRPVSHVRVLQELDRYVQEVDHLELKLGFYCLNSVACSGHRNEVKEIRARRDELLWTIIRMKDALDRHDISLAAGVSTGYCIQDDPPQASQREPKKPLPSAGIVYPYSGQRLKQVRQHAHQKSRLLKATVDRVATLGSVGGGCRGGACDRSPPPGHDGAPRRKPKVHGFTGRK